MATYGFSKKEKLKSRKQIDHLFAEGKSFTIFPLRVTYRFLPAAADPLMQAGVTAGKKYFKRAVDRNRIKRLMREAYRLQKKDLAEAMKQAACSGYVFFMYTDKILPPYETVMAAMSKCLKRLENKIGEINENPA
jgi:ribonuclease P protein component